MCKRTLTRLLFLVFVVSAPALRAQPGLLPEIAEPFKVGTFLIEGRPRVALVLRDSLIVDLAAANAALELRPEYPLIPMPDAMLGLIERYEYGLNRRQ